MAKISKKMKAVMGRIDLNKAYPIKQAIELAQKSSISKFDGSIDVAIKLNLDTTKVEQQLRGAISLPNSNGKKVRILVLDDVISEEQVKKAGAEYFGTASMIPEIEKMLSKIDLIITSPKIMPQLSKLGKILGPRGLMPNPKIGTVSTDVLKTVEEFSKGRIEYRTDSYGNIHMSVGKVSFNPDLIVENINTLIALIKSKKPATVKGTYIQNISVSPTMGLGIKVQIENN